MQCWIVEAVSYLGQKLSGACRVYRLAKRLQRRERPHAELLIAFDAMQAFYNSLPLNDRLPHPAPSRLPGLIDALSCWRIAHSV
jgi:hypothetical protein